MYRALSSLFVATMLTGCAGSGTYTPKAERDSSPNPKYADFAASSQYPSDLTPSHDLNLTATTTNDGRTLRLMNPSDKPMNDLRVWIDGRYVQHVDVISPNNSVTLRTHDFFDSSGRTLAQDNMPISRIEIQTSDNHLYAVKGPVKQ